MNCPTHEAELQSTMTRFGLRFDCPVDGCTVVCWSGQTSTPADAETRALRHKCHEVFDPLWRKKKRFRNRSEAYRWLRQTMGIRAEDAHLGMFTAAQCRHLLELLRTGLKSA